MRLVPLLLLVAAGSLGAEPSAVLTDFGGAQITTPVTPVVGSTLSPDARNARSKAVQWLLKHQHSDGGWASGNWGTNGSDAKSDVATTAYAVLALHRDGSGNTAAIHKGVEFVVRAVETAPEGPRLNTPEGTQIQTKVGPLVDTHFASLMLGELVPSLPRDLQPRARKALEVCVAKVERAQNTDGSFDGNAWAPVLSTAVAAQGLTAAADLGVDVDEQVLARSDNYQAAQANPTAGTVDTSAGAGVELYAVASAIRGASMTQSRSGAAAAPAEARAKARATEESTYRMVANDDGTLLAGFGSVGGEEMLSYMMISDTLAEKGGGEWREWEKKIGAFLASAQNADGSWVGHHCITSEAFATAGGIVTLSAGDHAARG